MYGRLDSSFFIKVGAFLASLTLLICIFILFLSKENSLFSNKITYITRLKDVQGLKKGASVFLRGIKVGTVKSLMFKGDGDIEISTKVVKSFQEWIKTDSLFSIKTQGVLGDKYLELSGGSASAPYAKDGSLLRINEAGQFGEILTKGEDVLLLTTDFLSKTNELMDVFLDQKGQLSMMASDLRSTMRSTERLISQLQQARPEKLITKATSVTRKIDSILDKVNKGPGTLHTLLTDPSLTEDVRSVLGGARRQRVLRYYMNMSIQKGELSDD